MKTAIIYSTTHGTTEKVSQMMQEQLGVESTRLFNLKKNKKPDLGQFDQVIIGGSIHAGMIQKSVKDFCKAHMVELLDKRLGLFLCGMNEPEYQTQMEKAFPEILRKHATAKDTMGGEFLFDKMNFFQRLIVQKISGIKSSMSRINTEKIIMFASNFRNTNQSTIT
jgi:menaquinone-dependent protoporphyrinogen oxidase